MAKERDCPEEPPGYRQRRGEESWQSGQGQVRKWVGPRDQCGPWSRMTGASKGCISQHHLSLAMPGLEVWFRKQPVELSRVINILYWFKKTLEVTNK